MRLTPGTRLGPYEITGTLGAGGMGEVYRAHDARLGRDVAIKILPAAVAGDPERMARFEREARLLASLQHPNIASIYGLEDAAGQRFIVMECVEGATLAERIGARGLPVPEALDVCRQIAAALEAAHEGGVIHRDLKPGNVKITPAGEVKVLDFGLAKGGSVSASSDANLSASPTMTYGATGVGVILGTAAYMSPEQARGKAVDRRTDIWSFGAVLFECLTGRQCFAGETLSDTIAKILQGEPEWSDLPAKTPASVRNLLARCLERDAKKRLRDIGDARIELDEAIAGTSSTSRASVSARAAAPGARPATARWFAIGAAAGLLLGIAGSEALRSVNGAGTPQVPLVRYPVELPEDLRMRTDEFTARALWAVSSDGSQIAVFVRPRNLDASRQGGPRIFVRRLADDGWRAVPGSELAMGRLRFARDGRSLFFVSRVSKETQDQRLVRAALDGDSPVVPVCDLPTSPDLVVLDDGRILLLHADGRRIAIQNPGATGTPEWKRVDSGAFTGPLDLTCATGARVGDDLIFVGTTDYAADGWHRGTAVLNLRTAKVSPVLRDGQWAVLLRDGHLLFTRGDALYAARFDRSKVQIAGEPVALLQGVRTRGAWVPGEFQVTSRGDLVYAPGGPVGERREIVMLDATGHASPISAEPRAYTRDPSSTEDAKRIACSATNARGIDEIWSLDAPDRVPQRVIGYPDADVDEPVLSRNGRWFAYSLRGTGALNGMYVASSTGDPEPRRVFSTGAALDSVYVPIMWLADGKRLLGAVGRFPALHLMLLDARPTGEPAKPRMLLPGYSVGSAALSPNERFLTFDSDHSGRDQIYVCTISPDGTTGAPVVVASSGNSPTWTADGTRVLYPDTTGFKSVHVSTAGEISSSSPTTLYDLGPEAERIAGARALLDGRTLVVMRAKEDIEATKLEVIQNWLESVREKLP
jgi:eukaryotic-like serine/threonine-protein kinase